MEIYFIRFGMTKVKHGFIKMFGTYLKYRSQSRVSSYDITSKSVVLFLLVNILISPSLLAVDYIVSTNDMHTIFHKKNIISKVGIKKAKTLTNFAFTYNKIRKSGKFSDDSINLLVKTLEEDPYAIPILKLLFSHWQSKGQFQNIIDSLYPIALKNPDALHLNSITANTLMRLKRDKEAQTLLEKALLFSDYKITPNITPANLGELISILSTIYMKAKDKNSGENMWDNALRNREIANQLIVRIAAINFYAEFADQGADGFFVGWSKRRYRRKLDANIAIFELLWRESNHQNALLLAPLLQVFQRYKMDKRAENILLEMLLENPYNSSALLVLAQSYTNHKRFSDATRAWQTIIDSEHYKGIGKLWRILTHYRSNEGDFYLELASVALKDKNYKEAIRAFDFYLLLNPEDSEIIFRLGFIYMQLRNYTMAILKFEESSNLPEANFYRAKCYMYEGRFYKALDAIQTAEKKAKILKRYKFLNDFFYIEYAFIADKAKDFNKTEDLLNKLLKKNPKNPMLNNFLGYFWTDRNKNLNKAMILIKKALNIDENNSAYLDSMAWVLYKKKIYSKSELYIIKALKIEDKTAPNAVIAEHAGDIFHANGDYKKAIKYWEIALKVYSEDIDRDLLKNKIDRARNSQFEKL